MAASETRSDQARGQTLRIGQAAELLGVGVDTLRRWELDGRLTTLRSAGGQRLVPIAEVSRLLDERRRSAPDRPIVAHSARNRFHGMVTRVERDRVAAVVEVLSGPHRLVSLMTAEAVDELDLEVGTRGRVCLEGDPRHRRDPVFLRAGRAPLTHALAGRCLRPGRARRRTTWKLISADVSAEDRAAGVTITPRSQPPGEEGWLRVDIKSSTSRLVDWRLKFSTK